MTTQVERPPVVQFVGGFIVTTLIFPLIILGAGGNWQWVEGWLFALWFDVMVLANMTYLYFKDPALLAERRKRPGSDNQKGWDAVMLSGIYVVALAWLAIVPPRSASRLALCASISSSAPRWKTHTCRRWSGFRTTAVTWSSPRGYTASCGIRSIWDACS